MLLSYNNYIATMQSFLQVETEGRREKVEDTILSALKMEEWDYEARKARGPQKLEKAK